MNPGYEYDQQKAIDAQQHLQNRETKHTPGPWIIMEWDGNCIRIVQRNSDSTLGSPVADVCPRPPDRAEECKANARLIAAAPALLEACKAVWDDTKGLSPSDYVKLETFQKIRAAIALAEPAEKGE